AEPEDETPLRLLGERALCRGRGVGFAQEDVRDASRDMEALRCGEEPARLHEGVPARYLREPEGPVAEGFDPPGELGGLPRRHRVRADPDPGVPDRAWAARTARGKRLRVRHHPPSELRSIMMLSVERKSHEGAEHRNHKAPSRPSSLSSDVGQQRTVITFATTPFVAAICVGVVDDHGDAMLETHVTSLPESDTASVPPCKRARCPSAWWRARARPRSRRRW